MQAIHIPELETHLEQSRASPQYNQRLVVRGHWENSSASKGILRALGTGFPEIHRICGGQLQSFATDSTGMAGFSRSCWRLPAANDAVQPAVLCALLGVYIVGGISAPRLRELQLKLRVLCPVQADLSVRPFVIDVANLTAMPPSMARWVALRLYSCGSLLFERVNGHSGVSPHGWTSAVC